MPKSWLALLYVSLALNMGLLWMTASLSSTQGSMLKDQQEDRAEIARIRDIQNELRSELTRQAQADKGWQSWLESHQRRLEYLEGARPRPKLTNIK